MVTGDTRTLDSVLDREFELVHMSGHVQPKDEWLGVVASGEFDYHSIQIDEAALSASITDDAAEVTGRGILTRRSMALAGHGECDSLSGSRNGMPRGSSREHVMYRTNADGRHD